MIHFRRYPPNCGDASIFLDLAIERPGEEAASSTTLPFARQGGSPDQIWG